MILLDTHVWVWWTSNAVRLSPRWEVAKLVQYGRLTLDRPVLQWIGQALAAPGVELLDLSPHIVVESTLLPGDFHKDPADQLLVATARIYDCMLMTDDTKILRYSHVRLI